MLNDPLSNAMSKMLNSEKASKKQCNIKPVSKVIKTVLGILKDNTYIGDFSETEDGKGNFLVVNLIGRINKCGSIKPRYAAGVVDYEKFEKRYLPAKGFGILVVSTSQGMMTHEQAQEKGIGGKLIAYCY